ncbi:MAG: hypothetical protein H7Z73_06695 [Candidatus Saccharibacteria bacterium]|nr:hypothetical protein [Moraxellaceae bacterium]
MLSDIKQKLQKKFKKKHRYAVERQILYGSYYIDEDRDMGLIIINAVIASPGEDHPAAYVFFVGQDMILLQGDERGLFCNFETKQGGFQYLILPYDVPVHLKGGEFELRQWITEAFICLGQSNSDQFIRYDHIEVLFDQQYTPRNFPR